MVRRVHTPDQYIPPAPATTARTRLEALRAEQAAASLAGLTADATYAAGMAGDIAAAYLTWSAAVGVAGCGRCVTAG